MKLSKFLTVFLLLITSLCGSEPKDTNNTIERKASKKTNKHSHKKKDKKSDLKESPAEKLTFAQCLQKTFDHCLEKYRQAQEKEVSIVRTFINAKEVSCSLNEAAKLYESASQIIKENLKITKFFTDKEILEKTIYSLVSDCDCKAKKCLREAAEWPQKVLEKKHIIFDELEYLYALIQDQQMLKLLPFLPKNLLKPGLHKKNYMPCFPLSVQRILKNAIIHKNC